MQGCIQSSDLWWATDAHNDRCRAEQAIVRMAQALSIDVIAEGVETELQIEALRALGCNRAQGFYFSRPIAAELIPELLAAADSARARPASSRAAASGVS